jgi:tRNA-dihydrouridine synthase A
MAHPEVVAAAVTAMRQAVDIEVTVKHRIGIDDLDRYEDMAHFVEVVARAGCRRFSVHARKAWLQGLSPKENRNVPPLRHRDVHRLKRAFPHLDIEINGGITTVEATLEHLEHVDGVMIGRAAYDDPMLFAALESAVFGERSPCPEPEDVVEAMIPYLERHNAQGGSSHHVLRHMHHLFAGRPGARAWRRLLTERAREPGAEVLRAGLAQRRDVLDRMARIRDQESAA